MSAALDPVPAQESTWTVIMTEGKDDPKLAVILARLAKSGLVLYVCESERCTRSRTGQTAVLFESKAGLECPWCGEPMSIKKRARFLVVENEEGTNGT